MNAQNGSKMTIYGEPRSQYRTEYNETRIRRTLGETSPFELLNLKIWLAVTVHAVLCRKSKEKNVETHMHSGPMALNPFIRLQPN